MKLIKSMFVFLAALPILQVHAVDIGPSAEPSCAQVICLSPEPGTPPPLECIPVRMPYFAIRIYDPDGRYNPQATSNARQAYIKTCTTALPTDIMRITRTYGMLYNDPIKF